MEYTRIEKLLVQLLNSSTASFTEEQKVDIREYIDVGEYGLALETFVDIVEEDKKEISKLDKEAIDELIKLFSFEDGVFDIQLKGRIVSMR